MLHHLIKQFAGAAAGGRRDGEHLLHAEGVELCIVQIVAGTVDLVDRQIVGLLGAAQDLGHLLVQRGETLASVHHEYNHIGLLDGELRLLADLGFENVVGADHIAARVNDREFVTVPVGLAIVTVARDACHGVHNGFPRLDQAVKQG